jgi:hypothetical protein
MALLKCKECGNEVSDQAKACPKCGAKVKKRWGVIKTVLVSVLGLWVIGVVVAGASRGGSGTSSTSGSATPIVEKTPKEQVSENLKLDYRWTKAGFDNIMELTGSITNKSAFAIKDLKITCDHFANSGTKIDSNTRMLYEAIPAGKSFKFQNFNMGFIHSQAASSSCEVEDFTIG